MKSSDCRLGCPSDYPIGLHGTCVLVGEVGVILRGRSGSGKSDLALRLIDGGAILVADDRIELIPRDQRVWARPPAVIAGLLEVRGVGIVRVPWIAEAAVGLVIDLVATQGAERLPEPAWLALAGIPVPQLALAPFEASAVAKVRLAAAAVSVGTLGQVPGPP
ncbi:HPr kinase/phosphorylase [uncultured Gammaproteobacteria bacterium]